MSSCLYSSQKSDHVDFLLKILTKRIHNLISFDNILPFSIRAAFFYFNRYCIEINLECFLLILSKKLNSTSTNDELRKKKVDKRFERFNFIKNIIRIPIQ